MNYVALVYLFLLVLAVLWVVGLDARARSVAWMTHGEAKSEGTPAAKARTPAAKSRTPAAATTHTHNKPSHPFHHPLRYPPLLLTMPPQRGATPTELSEDTSTPSLSFLVPFPLSPG